MHRLTVRQAEWIAGAVMFCITVFLLFFRPKESWYDDAYWADWAYCISQGGFITHVWGADQPSYNPLYALLLAGWYKVVGFSFVTAQLPNLIFAFAAYLVICLRWEDGKVFKSITAVIGFSFLYWFADTLYFIFTNGRPNTLCILLGVLTIDSFSRSMEKGRWQDILLFAVWSACMICTSMEGVVFTVVMLGVISVFNFKQYIKRWWMYVIYILSNIIGFALELAYMAYHNCGLAFLRVQFGFSSTVNTIMQRLNISGWESSIGVVENTEGMTLHERLASATMEGITDNREYIVCAILVISLLVVSIVRKQWKELTRFERSVIVSSIIMPWVYLLAGRYALYYTWAAYVPVVISLFVLMQNHNKIHRWLTPLLCCISVCWFLFSGNHTNFKKPDFKHLADKTNMADIDAMNIADDEAIYIPYSWYYYLAPRNNHLYFRGSGRYIKAMKRMVLSSEEEIEEWQKSLEIEYMYDIGSRKVYRVLGDYGRNILKDVEK